MNTKKYVFFLIHLILISVIILLAINAQDLRERIHPQQKEYNLNTTGNCIKIINSSNKSDIKCLNLNSVFPIPTINKSRK